jgi:hypothetical protein
MNNFGLLRRAEIEDLLRSAGLDPAAFAWMYHLTPAEGRECAGLLRRAREAKRTGRPMRPEACERWAGLMTAGTLRSLGFGSGGG